MSKHTKFIALACAISCFLATEAVDAGQRHKQKIVIKRAGVVNIVLGNPQHRHRTHRSYGTYSGDIAIVVRRGIGQWTYGAARATSYLTLKAPQPNAKIINVDSLSLNTVCRMQVGVCVIKP